MLIICKLAGCLLAIVVSWPLLSSGHCCLLATAVWWPLLSSCRCCRLATAVFWPLLSSGHCWPLLSDGHYTLLTLWCYDGVTGAGSLLASRPLLEYLVLAAACLPCCLLLTSGRSSLACDSACGQLGIRGSSAVLCSEEFNTVYPLVIECWGPIVVRKPCPSCGQLGVLRHNWQ